MSDQINIIDICHVNSSNHDNTFVGIKVNSNGPNIYFPMGFNLSVDEDEIRQDIQLLFKVLKKYTDRGIDSVQRNEFNEKIGSEFPVESYLAIINYYMSYGYYIEDKTIFNKSSKGKIDWPKTVKKQKPLLQENGSFVYIDFIVKNRITTVEKLITEIHKYLVYESFQKIGWLFGNFMPQKPTIKFNKNMFLQILKEQLASTNNDKYKILFITMIDVIQSKSEQQNLNSLFYGTNRFEYVWETMINEQFGILNKEDFFPKAGWHLTFNTKKYESSKLLPDTIMLNDEDIYILDAKYYSYGITKSPMNLPNSSSINKQITYGEYIETEKNYKSEKIFNAFLMPFNGQNNLFQKDTIMLNIGKATGDWRQQNVKSYDEIHGVLLDTKVLMSNSIRNNVKLSELLIGQIKKTK